MGPMHYVYDHLRAQAAALLTATGLVAPEAKGLRLRGPLPARW